MKCPKCHYLSFEPADRCRHCGYDLTLALDRPAPEEPPLQEVHAPLGPPLDLSLAPPGPLDPPASTEPPRTAREGTELDLPLFHGGPIGDQPLVPAPRPPRPPLSVRRATPEVPRARPVSVKRTPTAALTLPLPAVAPEEDALPAPPAASAPLGRRLVGGLVDAGVLVALNAAVVSLTLRLCELTLAEIGIVPLAPLAAFLLLLDGGYLTGFTAACGQTLGKMATGLRVVDVGGRRIGARRSLLRTIAFAVSVATLGLGFLPAVLRRDRRAVHDYVAGTRVVRG